jgi:HSP20 family molecular chaperone IbpA
VQAEYKQGILKVTVPKSETAMPKRIEVKTE